ncbi:hypothetical protein FBQ97_15520 [Acidobacteria bacterium ACD]|nr:hypothetical protein [Acidobacteria bacterium ACD]
MNPTAARTRRAALAAFFLFAAALALGATRAEASLPRSADAVSEASTPLPLELPKPAPPSFDPRLGFASSLVLLAPEAEVPRFRLFEGAGERRCERTYARNNPLKYVDPDGREVRFADSFIGRLKTDSQFKRAYQLWKGTPSGGQQFRRMVDDRNTVYTLSVGKVMAITGPLKEQEVNGMTAPVPSARQETKAGKLDLPAVESKVNADHIECDFASDAKVASQKMAKALFEESAHALDLGSNTKSFADAWKVEELFNTNTEPRMLQFELELRDGDRVMQ